MGFIEQLGLQAAGTAIGAGVGALTAKANDKRQIAMQRQLMDMQIQGSRELTDYNYQKQFDLWKNTNYQAQLEEMKKAGLNPGLIYGMGGGGGATTGGGGASVSVGDAPKGGGEIMQGAAMGLQLGMQQAQMELIKAQAEKTRTETKKIGGVDTEAVLQSISLMAQQEDNAKWEYELKRIQWASDQADYYVKQKTLDEAIAKFKAETGEQIANMKKAMTEAKVSEETQQQQIEQVKANLAVTEVEIALKKSGIAVNDQQIKKLKNDIAVALRMTTVAEKQTKLQASMQEWQKNFPGIGQATGRALNDAIESIFKLSDTERIPHYKNPDLEDKKQ